MDWQFDTYLWFALLIFMMVLIHRWTACMLCLTMRLTDSF